jgi:hypothetical protein
VTGLTDGARWARSLLWVAVGLLGANLLLVVAVVSGVKVAPLDHFVREDWSVWGVLAGQLLALAAPWLILNGWGSPIPRRDRSLAWLGTCGMGALLILRVLYFRQSLPLESVLAALVPAKLAWGVWLGLVNLRGDWGGPVGPWVPRWGIATGVGVVLWAATDLWQIGLLGPLPQPSVGGFLPRAEAAAPEVVRTQQVLSFKVNLPFWCWLLALALRPPARSAFTERPGESVVS